MAIWYGVDHAITNSDGTTAEHYFYRYRQEPEPAGAHTPRGDHDHEEADSMTLGHDIDRSQWEIELASVTTIKATT